MLQERPEFRHRDREIGPESVLAEEVVEDPAGGALEERDAPHVPGRMPGVFVLLDVVHQPLEERREDIGKVVLCRTLDVAGDERRSILELPDVTVDPGYDAERYGGDREFLGV